MREQEHAVTHTHTHTTDLLNQPELGSNREVLGCGVDVLTHVPCSGTLLLVVLAAVDQSEGLEERGEEGRLQHSTAHLTIVIAAQHRVTADKHLLQCVCVSGVCVGEGGSQ